MDSSRQPLLDTISTLEFEQLGHIANNKGIEALWIKSEHPLLRPPLHWNAAAV